MAIQLLLLSIDDESMKVFVLIGPKFILNVINTETCGSASMAHDGTSTQRLLCAIQRQSRHWDGYF